MEKYRPHRIIFACFLFFLSNFSLLASIRESQNKEEIFQIQADNSYEINRSKLSQADIDQIVILINEAKDKLILQDSSTVQRIEQKMSEIKEKLDDIKSYHSQNNSFLFSKYALYSALLLSTYGVCYYYGVAPSPSEVYKSVGNSTVEVSKVFGQMAHVLIGMKGTGQNIARNINTLFFQNVTSIKGQVETNNGTFWKTSEDLLVENTTKAEGVISVLNRVQDLSHNITAECVESVYHNPRWDNFIESYNSARINTILLGPLTLLNFVVTGYWYHL